MRNPAFYKNRKVLVTGCTGLVGANLLIELLKTGASVRGLVHAKKPVIRDKRIQYIKGNLTDKKDCTKAVKGIDFVFHCAANSSGAVVMKNNPIAHITENLIMTAQLLEACCLEKVERFLFLSSTTLYPPSEKPVKEEEAFAEDPYETYFGVGWMKRYIEKLAEFYFRRYGLKSALLRPTNVYGPYDKFDPERSHVLPALIRRAVAKENPFVVWGDGTAVRDFVYVDDMVEAMLIALEKAADCKGVNFGSGSFITIRESAEWILKLTGHDRAKLVFDAAKPTTIPVRKVDLDYSKKVLGFSARTAFPEGLSKTIDWYRQSGLSRK